MDFLHIGSNDFLSSRYPTMNASTTCCNYYFQQPANDVDPDHEVGPGLSHALEPDYGFRS